MRIIFVDNKDTLYSSLSTKLMVEEADDIEIVSRLKSADNLAATIARDKPDQVLISEGVFASRSGWQDYTGAEIVCFVRTEEGKHLVEEAGMPYYGIIRNASDLVDKIRKLEIHRPGGSPSGNTQVRQVEKRAEEKQAERKPEKKAEKEQEPKAQPIGRKQMPVFDDDSYADPPKQEAKAGRTEEKNAAQESSLKKEKKQEPLRVPEKETTILEQKTKDNQDQRYWESNKPYLNSAEQQFEQEFSANRSAKAKTICFYSAKGGVGKTTLSVEVATYLALMKNPKSNRKNRVCIVDYNIDFGDVVSSLNLDYQGSNMTYWASDIKARLDNGEAPEDINYDVEQMEAEFLQKEKNNRIGLFALLAPFYHEDSMDIDATQLEIMLRNIRENGNFDYVICDTGNNTRDATIIALDAADTIFLVLTQDVTTVNCNIAAFNALQQLDFDTSKVKIIVNDARGAKETANISADAVEHRFSFDSAVRISRNPDVTYANNIGRPLVLIVDHNYTQEIRLLIQYIVGVKIPEPPKKTFIQKLLSKFRK